MAGQGGFFETDERLRRLSARDPLEQSATAVDFELFRSDVEAVLGGSDRAEGGRPTHDAVPSSASWYCWSLYGPSDDQAEFQLRDRVSFMRFAGLALHDPVPDAETIWLFRGQLVRAGACERPFACFGAVLAERSHLAKAGPHVDDTILEARRPRLT